MRNCTLRVVGSLARDLMRVPSHVGSSREEIRKKEHEGLAFKIATISYTQVYNVRVLYFPLCEGCTK
jgi:hypothetical protein